MAQPYDNLNSNRVREALLLQLDVHSNFGATVLPANDISCAHPPHVRHRQLAQLLLAYEWSLILRGRIHSGHTILFLII